MNVKKDFSFQAFCLIFRHMQLLLSCADIRLGGQWQTAAIALVEVQQQWLYKSSCLKTSDCHGNTSYCNV